MTNPNDTRAFRNALGQFATGVTIITAKDENGGYVGTTASSFNSVSMDPALILWSIDKGARALPAYEKSEHFVVNVLAADQVSLSNHFARQQEDKFAGIDYALNQYGIPVLPRCCAVFECTNRFQYEGGDHLIMVGEVEQFTASQRKSLLFHAGSYAVSEKHPVANMYAPADAEETKVDSFADNYLGYLLGRSYYQMHNKLSSVLKRQELDNYEFRVLASLEGLGECGLAKLSHSTVLSEIELQRPLQSLQERGLLTRKNDEVQLTEAGHEKMEPLLAATRTNEAEALGTFSAQEALIFKSALRRVIEWTDQDSVDVNDKQFSLTVSANS